MSSTGKVFGIREYNKNKKERIDWLKKIECYQYKFLYSMLECLKLAIHLQWHSGLIREGPI